MELRVLWKNPSLGVSSYRRSACCPQLACTQRGWRAEAKALLSYCVWELTPPDAAPLDRARPGQPHQVDSPRGNAQPCQVLVGQRTGKRITLLMNGIFFAFLQWIKQHTGTPLPVHQKGLYRRGDYAHTLSSLLIHRTTSSACRADEPTWFCLQGSNFSSRRLLFAWQTTLFSSGQIWINKHYVFSWGQRAWLNESENLKKKIVYPPSISYWTITQGPAARKTDGVSVNRMGFLDSGKGRSRRVSVLTRGTATTWQTELPNGAGLGSLDWRTLTVFRSECWMKYSPGWHGPRNPVVLPHPASPQIPKKGGKQRVSLGPPEIWVFYMADKSPVLHVFPPSLEKSEKLGKLVN